MLNWIGIGILVLAGLVLVLVDNPGEAIGIGNHDFAALATGVALLVVIGGSTILGRRRRGGEAIRQAATWLGIALLLVVIYSYRTEFFRLTGVMAELVPGRVHVSRPSDDGSARTGVVAVIADVRGHFNVATLVNGTHVEMIADTGASTVALTYEDAQRVGIPVANLSYEIPIRTANGTTHGAYVTINTLSVGGIEIANVDAMVSQPGVLFKSLLGLSYLSRIGSFEISGDRLILRQ